MNIIDRHNIHHYHKNRIAAYGEGNANALGWKTKEGQLKRFEALSQIGDMANCSVLDAGCGYGDLCGFLNSKFSGLRYIGVDLEDAFLDHAVEHYSNTGETSFFEGDVTRAGLPFTDYILASGLFNYPNTDAEHLFKTIVKLFHNCRLGFGFNLLSKTDDTNALLVTHDPKEIVEFCKTLSTKVVLKEGYYENDFTVMVYHCFNKPSI
jgi:SAM-dependent methyltransferase